MATAEDVITKAFLNKEFLREFLENRDAALQKHKLELSSAERKRLDSAIAKSYQVTGLEQLKFIQSLLGPPTPPTPPPPPPWAIDPPLPLRKT